MRWREESRGRYTNDDNVAAGVYQEYNSDGSIFRTLKKLGFRREGVLNRHTGRFELQEDRKENHKWRTIEEWRAVLKNGGAELSEQERRELGLDQINKDMGNDDVVAALKGDEKWDVDVRAALGDVVVENVVLDDEGKLKGLIVAQEWD